MSKKIYSFCSDPDFEGNDYPRQSIGKQAVIAWQPPVLHEGKEWFVAVNCYDPATGRMRRKKFMLDRIKSVRERRRYAQGLMKRITERLMDGWNPWVELNQPKEYTLFQEVVDFYRRYLMRLMSDGQMREESVVSYRSDLRILLKWLEKENRMPTYAYQFDRRLVSDFLDYVYIGRGNSIRTRNGYVVWIKGFARFMLERGFISSNPTEGIRQVKKKGDGKNRTVIPDEWMLRIKDYLETNNRHFLLACEILHYMFVRPREMSFIRIEDISLRRKTLRIRAEVSKNHKEGIVTLPKHVIQLMLELKIFNSPDHYYLFSAGFAPGRVRESEKRFRDYWHLTLRRELGLPMEYKFYSLKDTGITNMLQRHTDVITVRNQARHSSIEITDIYTPHDVREANKELIDFEGVL